MISEKLGTILKKNTRTKVWWLKLGVAIILSNIFFFVLFGGDSPEIKGNLNTPSGWVEIQLQADLLTPFQAGKKILIVHRHGRKKLEGILQTPASELQGRITVLVKETEAQALLQHETWEVLPYLKHLNFASVKKENTDEIHY